MGRKILAFVLAFAMAPAYGMESVDTSQLTPAGQLADELGLPYLSESEVLEEALKLDIAELEGTETGLSSEEALMQAYRRGGFGNRGPWGRGQFVCKSRNRRGQVFTAKGFRPRVVQSRATSKCYRQSSRRGNGRWGKRQGRWGHGRGRHGVRCFDLGCHRVGHRGRHDGGRGRGPVVKGPGKKKPTPNRGGGRKGGGRRR